METQNNKDTFNYTYSAKQQEEIKNIRKKYAPPEEDKMDLLRRLDNSVNRKAAITSIIVGLIGALLLGIGMCFTIVWAEALFVPGLIIGIPGIGLICCAYPVYNHTLKKTRKKIAPEILKLTDELMR